MRFVNYNIKIFSVGFPLFIPMEGDMIRPVDFGTIIATIILSSKEIQSMSQHMSLTQSPRQSQTLAPQMRQGLKMLLMTHLELKAELQQQMMTNPVIEDVTSPMEKPLSEQLPEEHRSGAVSEHELDLTPAGEAAEKILSADDGDRDYYLQNMENFTATPESGSHDPDAQSRRDVLFDRQVKAETLQEHLQNQIPLSDIPQQDHSLAELLVGQIDDAGYFKGSIADIQMVAQVTERHILETLSKIAAFDPVGCGGRNLRECLLHQMEKLDDSPWEDEVRLLIEKHLEDVAAHREAVICRSLGIASADYPRVLAELRKLDPLPGRGFTPRAEASIYVRPEIFVHRGKSGKWVARIEDRDLPEIHISRKYLRLLEDPKCPAETKSYIRERLRAAEMLVQSLEERQNTIHNIAQAIVDAQTDVFEQKSMTAIKPLTMEQISRKVGVHTSTVSRTVQNKYMETPLGLIELRRFFVSGVQTEGGGEVANLAVKEQIRTIVAAEEKTVPLSDDAISKALERIGIKCARRTVAKYREAIGIPGVFDRRVK